MQTRTVFKPNDRFFLSDSFPPAVRYRVGGLAGGRLHFFDSTHNYWGRDANSPGKQGLPHDQTAS